MKLTKFQCFLCGRKAGYDRREDTLYRIEVHEIFYGGTDNRKYCKENFLMVPLCKTIKGGGCHGEAHAHKYTMKDEIVAKLGFMEADRINQCMNSARRYWSEEDKAFMHTIIETMKGRWL